MSGEPSAATRHGVSSSNAPHDPRVPAPDSHVSTQDSPSGRHPRIDRSDNSDGDIRSPWSKKIVITFDGGGVRGYSSLLVLKRLMFLIREIEIGERKGHPEHTPELKEPPWKHYRNEVLKFEFNDPVEGSQHCSWGGRIYNETESSRRIENDEVDENDIRSSVEKTFRTEEGKQFDDRLENFKPHHYFDYMFGTSTGGLSAIMLSRMKLSVDKALEQYNVVGNNVFAHPRFLQSHISFVSAIWKPKYSSKRMEDALLMIIGNCLAPQELKMKPKEEVAFASDAAQCRTVVVAFGWINSKVKHEYLFRSYDHLYPPLFIDTEPSNPGPASYDPIYKVARATSAAPLFFKPIKVGYHEYEDGAIVANNPAYEACSEVDSMHGMNSLFLLMSIGTGIFPDSDASETTDRQTTYAKRNLKVAQFMINSGREAEKTHRWVAKYLENRENVAYHRFNVDNDGSSDHSKKKIKLDEWRPETKRDMMEQAISYLTKPGVHSQLLECARLLVAVRRRRAATERWESFATDNVYYCPESDCRAYCRTRQDLRNHAYESHRLVWETHVSGSDRRQWACFWDHCQQDGVSLFGERQDFIEHLYHEHHVPEHQRIFSGRHELDEWLDQGRHAENFGGESTQTANGTTDV